MKTLLTFCFLWLSSAWVSGQTTDRMAAEREIDSLLEASRKLGFKGQYDEALLLNETAKKKAELAFGQFDTTFAKCIFFQAMVCDYNYDYSEANRLFDEFLDVFGKSLDKESTTYAKRLLYWIYFGLNNDRRFCRGDKAESLCSTAKGIVEKAVGKEHLDYAVVVQSQGAFYVLTGQHEKAEPLILEAKNIYEQTLGKAHTRYAEILTGLGFIYNRLKKFEEAEKCMEEAREVWGKARGKSSEVYFTSTYHLARTYFNRGGYSEAETLLLEAKAGQEEANQKATTTYPLTLLYLAQTCQKTGYYADAEKYYLEVKDAYEAIYGKHGYATSQYANIGYMYAQAGLCDKVEVNILKFYNPAFHSVIKACRYLAPADLAIKIDREYRGLSGLNETHYLPQGACQIPGIRYDIALLFKGMLMETGINLRKLAFSDSTSAKKYQLLQHYHGLLAKEYADPAALRQNIEEYERKSELLEKELVRTLPGYGEAMRLVTWREVQAQLKPGEAGVEFMHYSITDTGTVYSAVVLRYGDTTPTFIPLFKEKQLAGILPKTDDFERVDEFYSARTGRLVLQLIWQPLDSLLQGINTVYCSPSGLLHRINLGAVPLDSSQTFSDRFQLVLVGSTKQLVESSSSRSLARHKLGKGGGNIAALFGGVEYDSKTVVAAQKNHSEEDRRGATDIADAETLPFPYDTTLRGGNNNPWRPLPATETEVRNIAALLKKRGFKTSLQTGAAATEETFKQLGHPPEDSGSPRILHLATHGYFFPDPKQTPGDKRRKMDDNTPAFKASEHPMIRSGLILAGANPTWTTGKPPAQGEDGILTAYEISQMNLSNTELVVLSACETGLGDLVGNEGVYGLQRAFKIAGAKYLIMSLWQVSDRLTGELMTEFYRQYLEKKKSVPDAFRDAQQAMRTKYQGSASAWAGFVLME